MAEAVRSFGSQTEEGGRSFRDYILSRRNAYGRIGAPSWRFVIQALGDEAILAAGAWIALKRQIAGAPASDLAAARTVWRSYERWRDGRDLARPRRIRRPC